MGATQRVDIERLLVWAYREQEVDRRVSAQGRMRPAKAGGTNWPTATMALGARVDVCGAGTRLAALERAQNATADDALTIHDAVLALDDVWIEMAGGEATLWTPQIAAAEGLAIAEGATPRDATLRPVTPNGRVANFSRAALDRVVVAPLIILHARAASRPDWHEGWSAGRAQAWAGERDRWGRLRGAGRALCEARPQDVARDRALWLVWRAALGVLAVDLERRLDRWAPTGPDAPESPWELRGRRVVEALIVQPTAPRKPLKRRAKKAI